MTTLRQLAEAATPGPWWIDSHGHAMNDNDASYISAANPTTILALLDTIDTQRKLLERAETVLSASYGDFYDEIFEVVVLNEITAHLEATK